MIKPSAVSVMNSVRGIASLLVIVGVFAFQAGPAFAGSGGAAFPWDMILIEICNNLGLVFCPDDYSPPILDVPVPSNYSGGTGFFLEIAALTNQNPSGARQLLRINPRSAVSALNPLADEQSSVFLANPTPFVIPGLAGLRPLAFPSLSNLTPLAFISPTTSTKTLAATQLNDPAANSFLYAVATGAEAQPKSLDLFFDFPPQTHTIFRKGQDLGNITLPLAVLNDDSSERRVTVTLQIGAACTGGFACLTATVIGDFLATGTAQEHSAAEAGLIFGVHFGPSPNSTAPHAIFEVRVPLLVTGPANPAKCGAAILAENASFDQGIFMQHPDPADCGNDAAYFGVKAFGDSVGFPTGINQISGIPTAFRDDVLGFSPAFLRMPIGIAPPAAPFGASFSDRGGITRTAVSAYLAIGTDGTTLVSALLPCALVPASSSFFGLFPQNSC